MIVNAGITSFLFFALVKFGYPEDNVAAWIGSLVVWYLLTKIFIHFMPKPVNQALHAHPEQVWGLALSLMFIAIADSENGHAMEDVVKFAQTPSSYLFYIFVSIAICNYMLAAYGSKKYHDNLITVVMDMYIPTATLILLYASQVLIHAMQTSGIQTITLVGQNSNVQAALTQIAPYVIPIILIVSIYNMLFSAGLNVMTYRKIYHLES